MKKLTLAILIITAFSIAYLYSESKPKSAASDNLKNKHKESAKIGSTGKTNDLTDANEIFKRYRNQTNFDSLKNANGFNVHFGSNMIDLKTKLQFWYLRPDKMKLKFRVRNYIITVVYDGKEGWSKNSIIGVIPIQPSELPMLRKFAFLVDGPLHEFNQDWKMSLLKDSAYDVDGRPAYKIEFTDPKGVKTYCFFSKENCLMIKAEFITNDAETPVPVQIYYSEYKNFDNGLILPTRMDYIAAGALEEMTIDSLQSGLALNHKDFLKPF